MFGFGASAVPGSAFAEHFYQSFIDIPDDQLCHTLFLQTSYDDINDITRHTLRRRCRQ